MAKGDPPVTGNPAAGPNAEISFEAKPNGTDPDFSLVVPLKKNKRLLITIDPGTGNLVTTQVQASRWKMTLEEID